MSYGSLGAWPLWGLIDRIYVGDYKTLLHTKYISCVPHGFRKEDFLKFSPIISPWELLIQFEPQGLGWQDLGYGPTRHCYILNV